MDNTAKTKQKSKFKSILSLAIVFCLSILTMLTFTACKWRDDTSDDGLATVDANGNLRITSPYVEFNPYSLVNGAKVIDDNSGSFTWELMYYLSGGNNIKKKDIGFDQVYLLSNFYYDAKYENNFVYSNYSSVVPVYASSASDVLKHFAGDDNTFSLVDGSSTLYRNNSGSTYEFESNFTPGWYALIEASASEQATGRVGTFKHIYSKSDEVDVDDISFPDFEIVVDGRYYTFQTIVNKDYLKKFSNISLKSEENKLTKNLFYELDPDEHKLFTFKYRTGKYGQGKDFVDCPAGMMDYFIAEDGTFNIRFNPRLEEGSTNRYLKVRALPNSNGDADSQRANSLYSTTVSFEAYAVAFEVNSPNSTELNYGGLTYDADKYYFANKKAYSYSYEGKNYDAIKSLVGFFPEGRKIVVQRTAPYKDNYDYGFQAWTTNTKSENSLVLENGLPYNSSYDLIGANCLEKASTINSDAFKSVTANTTVHPTLSYYEKNNSNASFTKLVYDYLPTDKTEDGYTVDTLTVVSHSTLNSYKFYANYAKVRNFLLSGTFFAGDNFFTGNDQKLSGVSINLFFLLNGNYGSPITLALGTEKTKTFTQKELGLEGTNSHIQGVTITQDGAYFKVTGLEKDDFLIFQKEELVNGTRRPYSFHSALMVKKTVETFGTEFKTLDLMIDSNYYSDRQDLGIIGTQYSEQSNLVVNLYQLTENGDTQTIDGTSLKLLQDSNISYEVIKSVSTVEDEYGYITTNVIISLILPSNATLVGYNAETLITTSTEYYGIEGQSSPKYVAFIKYNEKTAKNTYVDLDGKIVGDEDFAVYSFAKVQINSSLVTRTLTSQYVSYNNKIYSYDHKEIGGYMSSAEGNILYFYKSGTNSSEFLINEGNDWYTLTYTAVNKNNIEISASEGDDGVKPEITINGELVVQFNASGNIYNVSTIAKAHETDMRFAPDNKDAQTVFVYYDIKQYGRDYFYTSPIARVDSTIVYDANDETTYTDQKDVMYFDLVSNFEQLKQNKTIMLGSEIYSSSDSNAKNFKNVMGSSIILNCYYYVKPLGDITELAFKQYLAESSNSDQTQQIVRYYYEDGIEYKGGVVADSNNTGKVVNFYFYNQAGERIDLSVYDEMDKKYNAKDVEFKLIFESLFGDQIAPDLGVNYENRSNLNFNDENGESLTLFKDTKGNTRSFEEYGLANKLYNTMNKDSGSKLGSANLVLYEVDPESGEISTTPLYFNGSSYHRIVGEAYLTYVDGTSTKTESFSVYERKALTFKFKGNKFDNYLNSITITEMTVDGVKVQSDDIYREFEQRQATKNSYGKLKFSTNTVRTYLKYLVTTYDVKEDDSITTYYPVASTGGINAKTELIYNIQNEVSTITNYVTNQELGSKEIYVYNATEKVYQVVTSLVRSAQKTDQTNTEVAVLGKYIVTNDQNSPTIYPSFSSYLEFSTDDAFILNRNSEGEVNYYDLDYTSKNNVIEGFPGFSLLAGLPYPNPVLYFSVRHKATESPVINISLQVEDAFYVEVAGTNIKTEDSNLIKDFTTYSFKDTITNLTQNDYIDKTFWVLERSTFTPIYALVDATQDDYDFKNGNNYYKYYMFTYDDDGKRVPVELSIQNIGVNTDDNILYANTVIGANGKYFKKLYYRHLSASGEVLYTTIDCEKDVILWKTDSSSIKGVPTYDIHSYTQGLDGIIYFNSGSSFNDNIICNGLTGITSGATNKASGRFDYSEVMISGVTYAYRTLASQVNNSSNLSGYQFDKMVNILNAYNSKDAYFLTGKEAVVLVASPIVNLTDDAGNSYIYRFKEWQIYSRYNSEVLYYNRGETERSDDRYNAIMRFSADEAGYFVFFPIYERVFNIDIGTAVVDGAVNQGGGVNVKYRDGDEIKAGEAYDDELYFVNYEQTNYQGKDGYYYGDLNGSAFLYFTGEFAKDENNEERYPIFSYVNNVYKIDANIDLKIKRGSINSGDVTFYFMISNGYVEMLNILTELEAGVPGIVEMENYNGQYSFIYNEKGSKANQKYAFENEEGFYIKSASTSSGTRSKACQLSDIMGYAFTSTFFFDSITKSDYQKSVSLYYDQHSRTFFTLDLSSFDKYCRNQKGEGITFYNYVYEWNVVNNNHIFKNGSKFLSSLKNKNSLNKTISAYGMTVNSVLGDFIATATTNYFTVLQRVTDNPYIDGLNVSRYGSLSQGELVKDENGNIYSTQQFKTAYIDRDSYVELQAVAQNGYRFEGWYKCIYDEEGGFWYTTDEKVENSDDIYSDEILQAYKNPVTDTYYYITDYYTTYETNISQGENTVKTTIYTYFFDADKTNQAIVPDRMLDKVRGYFINNGSDKAPNYIQVYKYTGNLSEEYYYDQALINRVDTTIYSVSEMAYVDAINFAFEDQGTLTLSNEPIFKKEVENINGETSYRYYRVKTTGNVVVDGDTIRISTLHSNLRYVAKFIETYNQYIFAESEESSGISIEAVYYSNNNQKYDANGDVIIRTNYDGLNRTYKDGVLNDNVAAGLDYTLFRLYEDQGKNSYLIGNNQVSGRYNDYSVFNNLRNGFGSTNATYRVNKHDSDFGGTETVEGILNLRSMYFDVDTTVHIVVRVKADFNLTIHSLGVNSKYEIVPIFYPTSKFIDENQKAKAEDKIDYLYYIFKLTYNRNPENEYANYIVHPNRGENMSYDAISGNFSSFYSKYINIIDNYNNVVKYTTNANGSISLDASYLNSLINSGVISLDDDVKKEILSNKYDNVQKALYDIGFKIKNPSRLYPKGIRLKVSLTGYDTITTYSNLDTIFDIIKEIFRQKVANSNAPYLIRTGQRNFINFSTIPIYNYTVQAYVIDSEGDELKYDENNHIVLPNSNKDVVLANSIYVNAGTNNRTYLGNGTKLSADFDYISGYGNTSMKFTTRYTDLEYGTNGTNKALFEDMPFAQNTIVLLQGIETAPNGNYIFAGWYEQKYDRETKKWSNLVYISNEEQTPYISLATADTVILAVYKRAVDVTFEIDESKMALQLSNGFIDSTGNPMTVTYEANNIVKYSGKFYFDAKVEATVAPTGGYRYSSISYFATSANGSTSNGTAISSNITYYKYIINTTKNTTSSKTATFDEIETNKTFTMVMNLNTIIRNENAESGIKATVCDSLNLTFETKKTVLVYLEVENYLVNSEHMGYNFALVKLDGNTQQILFRSNGKKTFTAGNDSANNKIVVSNDSGRLVVYGYFDVDLSDKLVLVTCSDSNVLNGVNLWYINSNTNSPTNAYPELNSNVDIRGISGVKYAFDICFEYEQQDKTIFNNAENFDLSKENSIYYAKAIIQSGNKSISVKHTYSENLSDFNNNGGNEISQNVTVNTLMTFSGICYSKDGVLNTVENSSIALETKNTFTFNAEAKINFSTYSNYLIINGKLYVFVGWFYHNSQSESTYLVSYDTSISDISPDGYFEARYVRAVVFNISSKKDADGNALDADNPADISVDGKFNPDSILKSESITLSESYNKLLNAYGQLNVSYNTASNTFTASDSSVISYALVGSEISFTITPPIEKRIRSIVGETNNGLQVSITASTNESIDNAINYEISNLCANTDANALNITYEVEKGYVVTIKQTLFNDFSMSSDGTDITSTALVNTKYYDNGEDINLIKIGEFTVQSGSTLKFSNLSSTFYFIGFFINGQIVSLQDGKYLEDYTQDINENVVIEARYCKYNYFAVNSYIQGTTSSVNGFNFLLTYTNPRTNSVVRVQTSARLYKVPAGINVTVEEKSGYNSNPYRFAGFALVDPTNGNIYRTLSTEQTTTIPVTLDKASAFNTMFNGDKNVNFVNIGVIYQMATKLRIDRNIVLSEIDKNIYAPNGVMTDEFKAMLDVIVTYTDPTGDTKTISLSSKDSIANLEIQKGSTFYVQVAISDLLKDRYHVDSVSFTSNESEKPFTIRAENTYEVPTTSDYSELKFIVNISAYKFFTVSKLLNNYPAVTENVEIEYTVGNQTGSLTDQSEKSFSEIENVEFTLTAKTNADGYEFIGWYNGGKKISSKTTISISDIAGLTDADQISITPSIISARFVSITQIKSIRRSIDGVIDKDHDELDVKIVGNIIQNKDSLVKMLDINNTENRELTDISVLGGSQFSLYAGHIEGYTLIGFKVSNGSTERFVAADSDSSYYTAITSVSENIEYIEAVYETTKKISYNITTINPENQTPTSGASIFDYIGFYSKSNNYLNFKLNLQEGYALSAVYVDNEKIDIPENSTSIRQSLEGKTNDVCVEIVVVKQTKLNVYISVDDSADATVLKNRGIEIDKFIISLNGQQTLFSSSLSQSLLKDYTLNGFTSNTLNVSYNGLTSFVANNIEYKFYGFYQYDGSQISTSVVPINVDNTVNFVASRDISIIAKFESHKLPVNVETTFAYEFINSLTETPEKLTSFDGIVEDGKTTRNGADYMFIGYYARLNDISNSYSYMCLSTDYNEDLTKYDGVYSNVVARFVKLVKITITNDINSVTNLIANTNTTLLGNPDNLAVKLEHTENGYVLTLPVSMYADLKFESLNGYNLSDGSDLAKTNEIVSFVSVISDQTYSQTASRTGYDVKVVVRNNNVVENQITLTNSEDSVTFDKVNEDTTITLSVSDGFDSVMHAGIYNISDDSYQEITISSADNNKVINLPYGSIITLSYELAGYEVFKSFEFTTATSTDNITVQTYDYHVTNVSAVTITARFKNEITATITENDENKGSASIVKSGDQFIFTARANAGYKISNIYVATVTNGVVGSYVLLSTDKVILDAYFTTHYESIVYSDPDTFATTYQKQFTLTFTSDKNIAFKVEYMKVAVVKYNLITADETPTVVTAYYDETESPLTLAEISSINFMGLVNSDDYILSEFVYKGEVIDDSTEISLLDSDIYEINVNFVIRRYVKVIVKRILEENGKYNTPTDGISVKLNENIVSTANSSNIFEYSSLLGNLITTADANLYFDFIGYFATSTESDPSKAISTSASTALSATDFNELSTVMDNGRKVYVLYATMKERIQTLTISREDPTITSLSIEFNGNVLTPTTTLQFVSTTVGNISYKYSSYDDDRLIIVSYPYSVAKGTDSLKVFENTFTANTTDPILGKGEFANVSVFYEKTVGGNYYRFDNFYDQNDIALGTKYTKEFVVKFNQFKAGGTITAKALTLNQIEYVYDLADENIIISLEIVTVEKGALKNIVVATSSNKTTFGQALISYKAEQGMTVRVSVDFSAYEGSNLFSTIIANDGAQMISSIIGENETIPTTNSWDSRLKGYVPVSKLYNKNNQFNSYIFNGKSAFSFSVSKNISFVADFYGGFKNYRGFIVGSLINPTDSRYSTVIKNNGKILTGNTGNGFVFVVGSDGIKYYVDVNYDSQEDLFGKIKNKWYELIDYSDGLNKHKSDFYVSNSFVVDEDGNLKSLLESEKSGTISTKQLDFAIQVTYYAKLTIDSEQITKGDFNIRHDKTFNIEEIADDDVLFLTIKEDGKTTDVKDTLQYANRYKVNVKAMYVEGYYFKGFALISTNYENAYNVVQLGGETADAFGTQYNFVKYNAVDSDSDGIYNYFEAEVTLTGRTKIVAVYEPRVYVITLNTYKYDDSKETEAERMTTEYIQASTITGSLLVERGHNSKISSTSYQYSQFVGYATTDRYDGKIRYAYDTGTGVDPEDATDLEKNDLVLHSNEVYPGLGDDKSTAMKNNFYALNVYSDFELNLYYTALSYDLIIDLAEIETVWSENILKQSVYLAYADYVRNQSGWKNPSAGTYRYTVNYGTNKRNSKEFTNTITIDKNDPFVYVFNDSNDTEIGYPTKIANTLISTTLSTQNGKLTYTSGTIAKIAKCSGGTCVGDSSTKNYQFKEGHGSEKELYANGYDINITEMDSNGNPVTRNIFDFVTIGTTTVNLKKGLFTISVRTEENGLVSYDSAQLSDYLEYDLSTGKVKVKFKVVATDNGFPDVSVSVKDVSSTITRTYIKNVTETENIQTATEKTPGFTISGFNMAVFDDDRLYTDPNFDFGSLDVNLLMTWLVASRAVSAKVKVGSTTVDLTATNKSKTNALKEKSNDCRNEGSYTDHLLNNDHDEITSYQLFFIKNGYTLANWLKEIIEEYLNEVKGTSEDSDIIKAQYLAAGQYYGDLFGSTIGSEGEFGAVVGTSEKGVGTGATGTLLDDATIKEVLNHVWYMQMFSLCNRSFTTLNTLLKNEQSLEILRHMQESITLEYRCIDVYELYKKGVDINFYNNSLNANDFVLSQCLLQEHQQKQVNHKGFLGVVWSADKGYAYYNLAKSSFNVQDTNGSFGGGEYSNAIKTEEGNTTTKPTGTWDKIGKWFVGLVDGTGKYGGTYNRIIFISFAPSSKEFSSNSGGDRKFIVTTTIDKSEGTRVPSALYDYYGTIPVLNAVLGLLINRNPLVRLIDGIITIAAPDKKTIFETIVNLF